MGFNIYGSPIIDFSNKIKSKEIFKIYFSTWLSSLNFQTYKRNFTKNLRTYINKNEVEVDYNENKYFEQQSKQKNDFIKWELKSIQSLLKIFDKLYTFHNIDEYNKGGSSENLTSEKETFIINYKNLNDAPMKQSAFLFEYIKYFECKHYFQWIDIMYLDILKTKDYLTNLFVSENTKATSVSNKENNFNITDTDFELIKNLVSIKIKELQEYKQARFGDEKGRQITRHSYESFKIANYLNNNYFSVNMVVAYLTILKKEIINNDIKIIEYRPHNDYDGTQDFLNWIDKEFINIQLKQKKKQAKASKKAYPFYCKIGALFAKGQIEFRNQKYYYRDYSFVSIAKLSKHIQNNVLNSDKAVRQYVNDTLFRTGVKNFYDSFTMMNNIVAYCQENNIETTVNFQNIYTQLKNLH